MSLKDKGNDEFKKGNLNKAIELYLKYLEEDHQDNNLAYNNLAFCYFKLKEYSKCIEACENSLELVRQNPKVYYRLYMTYKQMEDQYQTFINAHLFLKYYQEDSPNAKSEALKIMKEFKAKFTKKNICPQIKPEQSLINDLQLMGKACINQSLEAECEVDWSTYLEDINVSVQQKMKIIKDKIIKQYSLGINLAYLLVNITKSQAEKRQIVEQIAIAKRQYLEKSVVKKLNTNEETQCLFNKQAQKQESAEDSENLFQQVPKKPKTKTQQSKLQTESKPKTIIKTQQNPMKTVTIAPKISDIKPKDSLKKTQSEPIQTEFQRFITKPPQSHDVFKQMFSIIQKILTSDLSQQNKRGFLQKMQKRYSQMNMLKYSLTDNESKQMFQLLSKNCLQNQFKIYKSK